MAEADRTAKNNELKIKKRDYTGYDDEEFEPGKQGMKRAVLSKYDEDIEGPRQTVRQLKLLSMCSTKFPQDFRLGNGTTASQAVRVPKKEDETVRPVNMSLLSIDYASESLRIHIFHA
jgi:U4/U6.U5 tri-snRNP-associated protein 1